MYVCMYVRGRFLFSRTRIDTDMRFSAKVGKFSWECIKTLTFQKSDMVRTPLTEIRTVAEKNAQKSLFFRIIKGVRYEISAWAANTR